MKVNEIWKFHGNVKRIIEMDAAGVGANAIAGVFQDHGMKISADDVRGVVRVATTLSRKALPKKAARMLIQQNNVGGLEPA